jgi:hypothetical protein
MQIRELIQTLENIEKVHPEVKVVSAVTRDGKTSHQVAIHLLERSICICGERT